jgi:hypothetical protein
MITHQDYDESKERSVVFYKLPEQVTNIVVCHDGGRLTIYVNDVEVFYSCEGTRDCCVTINSEN